MTNRNIYYATIVIFAIFLISPVGGFAADKIGGKTNLKPVSSDKNQINQTENVDQTQVISEKEPIAETPEASDLRAGEQINWQVLSGGGTDGSSASYNLLGTVGQTAVGAGSSINYGLTHGYWQGFTSGICDCVPGEADGKASINILDVVYIINYKYKSGPNPIPYETCSADADANCAVNILDVVYVINFKYKGGPDPATCEEWTTACGALH